MALCLGLQFYSIHQRFCFYYYKYCNILLQQHVVFIATTFVLQFEIYDSDRHKRGEHKISPMVKEVFAIDTHWMREIGFHQCSGTGYINHTSR